MRIYIAFTGEEDATAIKWMWLYQVNLFLSKCYFFFKVFYKFLI